MSNDTRTLLTEGWGELKEGLLSGLKPEKREIVAPLLENQRNELLNESAPAGAIDAHSIANFRKALLPMIRRIIPNSIGTEIVGVQPMSGPVSQVYTMRYTYEEDMTHDPNNSQFGGFDIAAGDEAFGNAKPIRQFYAGGVVDGSGDGIDQEAGSSALAGPAAIEGDIDAATAQGGGWGSSSDVQTYETGTSDFGSYSHPVGGSLRGGSGSFLEASGGRKMGLNVVSQAVEAYTRKLQASWTIEAMQDMKSQHGLDIENEITRGLSQEITHEIDAEIINDLLALAGTVRTYDHAATGGPTYAPAFVGDRFANVGTRINEIANVIARKTRRDAGNFIVASPMMVSVLQTANKAVFAPAVEGDFGAPSDNKLVGTLNGRIKVYSYLWNQAAPGSSSPAGDDSVLVGYKGGNNETDAGYFYAPYVPIMSSGVMVNPQTTMPSMSLMTRYGKVAFTDPNTSLGNSADYYGKLNITNLDFS